MALRRRVWYINELERLTTPTHTSNTQHATRRYVNCEGMAKQAVAAVRSGELKILPAFHEATWYRWLDNIR